MTYQKLWFDDQRPPPADDWYWAKDLFEATYCMSEGEVEIASLDHDLGLDEHGEEVTGYKLVLWMAQQNVWPRTEISVHSMNPVGAERICGVIERYGPYQRRIGRRIFQVE